MDTEEDSADPLLHFEDDGGDGWQPTPRQRAGTRQRPIAGGHGAVLLNTFDGAKGDEATGSEREQESAPRVSDPNRGLQPAAGSP